MTELTLYDLQPGVRPVMVTSNQGEIASRLQDIGVRYDRWRLAAGSDAMEADDLLNAYAEPISILRAEGGYAAADVVRLRPNSPGIEALREKFLAEHIHSEDEVRIFVSGTGAFYLRNDDQVLRVICGAGDLLSVPAGMRHWFDTGKSPNFTALRLFTNPTGWVAEYTGDPVARFVPLLDGPAPETRHSATRIPATLED